MIKPSSLLRDLFAVFVVMLIPVIVFALPVGILYVMLLTRACDNLIINTVSDLSGLEFETAIAECDSPVRNSYVDIFVSKTGRTNKILLFKYGPVFDNVNRRYITPSITVNDKTIFISIEKIDKIYSLREHWNDYGINYQINDIIYR